MKRLLLVDDARWDRDAFHAALDPYGFELVDAENGAVALQLLSTSHFDLAFVDFHMPVMDGPTLVRMLKARGIKTSIVLVSAGAQTPMVAATIKAGAKDYLAKPLTSEQITAVTARLLGLRPDELVPSPAEVLVQHTNPWVSGRLRGIVPARVHVTDAPTLAKTLEMAEQKNPALVLLDEAVLEGDVVSAAGLVRAQAPVAGIFALTANATKEEAWAPDGPLDGQLPMLLGEPVVRGFLYPIFLRPLVYPGPSSLRAASFEGEDRFLEAYFTALARSLAFRASKESPSRDLFIDLTGVPTQPKYLAGLILMVHTELDRLGAAPLFKVPATLVEDLRGRSELARSVILPPT